MKTTPKHQYGKYSLHRGQIIRGDKNLSNGTGPDSTGRQNIGFKLCLNIGNAFAKIVKYHGAIHNYESATSSSPNHKTGVNVLLCYIVLGDTEKVSGVIPNLCNCP